MRSALAIFNCCPAIEHLSSKHFANMEEFAAMAEIRKLSVGKVLDMLRRDANVPKSKITRPDEKKIETLRQRIECARERTQRERDQRSRLKYFTFPLRFSGAAGKHGPLVMPMVPRHGDEISHDHARPCPVAAVQAMIRKLGLERSIARAELPSTIACAISTRR